MYTDSRGYSYRSKRNGTRIEKEYIGRGQWIGAAQFLDTLDRNERESERDARRVEQAALDELDAPLLAFDAAVNELVESTLSAAGYHRHQRGQWRKRRAEPTKGPTHE